MKKIIIYTIGLAAMLLNWSSAFDSVWGIIPFLALLFALVIELNRRGFIDFYGSNNHVYRLGLDIHGVIDASPKFYSILTKLFMEAGHEVHILTGSHITDEVRRKLHEMGIMWTHLFSISDHHKSNGKDIIYDKEGTPWIDDESWNRTKADYCRKNGIDYHIDDTAVYGDFFTTPFALMKVKDYQKPTKKINPLNNIEDGNDIQR